MKECVLNVGPIRVRVCAFYCNVWMMKKPELRFTITQPHSWSGMEHDCHSRSWYLTVGRVIFGVNYERYTPTRIDGVPQ